MDIILKEGKFLFPSTSLGMYIHTLEFSKTIDKFKILIQYLGPALLLYLSDIIFGPAGPLNWADQILCDTGRGFVLVGKAFRKNFLETKNESFFGKFIIFFY